MATDWWQVNIDLSLVPDSTDTAGEIISSQAFEFGAKSIWENDNNLLIGFDHQTSATKFASMHSVSPTFVSYEFNQPDLGGLTFSLPNGRDIEIKLDTSRSFGHGKHPTTNLAMESIANYPAQGGMLDVGSGTGVLSILAAKLGHRVTAVDNDAKALDATLKNCETNDVELEMSATSIDEIENQFDLVVANIVLSSHQEIFDRVLTAVKPNGQLVLTGFHIDQIPQIAALYQPFEVLNESTNERWACLECRRMTG